MADIVSLTNLHENLHRGLCTKYVRSREILMVYLVMENSLPGSLTEKECLVTPRRSDQPSCRRTDNGWSLSHLALCVRTF